MTYVFEGGTQPASTRVCGNGLLTGTSIKDLAIDNTPGKDNFMGSQEKKNLGCSPSKRKTNNAQKQMMEPILRTPDRNFCISPSLSQGLLGEARGAVNHGVGM